MVNEQTDLINWITEIHGGMYKNLVSRIDVGLKRSRLDLLS
jgi:hypothetical protein